MQASSDPPESEIPVFDDEAAIRLAVSETKLPRETADAVLEAQGWFLILIGAMPVEGPMVATKREEAHRLFPGRFPDRPPTLVRHSYDEEAEYIAATTGLGLDTVTTVLKSVRHYEEQIAIVCPGVAADYADWREGFLATRGS